MFAFRSPVPAQTSVVAILWLIAFSSACLVFAPASSVGAQVNLLPPSPTTGGQFGWSVDIDGGIAVVGEPGRPDGGRVHVYERNAGGVNAWGRVKTLTIPGTVTLVGSGHRFGHSVAVWGDTLVVGAPFAATSPAFAPGLAYVFEKDRGGPGNWGVARVLRSGTPNHGNRFALDVDIVGDWIAVGEPSASPSREMVVEGSVVDVYWSPDLYLSPIVSSGEIPEVGQLTTFQRNLGGPGNWGGDRILLPAFQQSDLALEGSFGLGALDHFGHSVAVSVEESNGEPKVAGGQPDRTILDGGAVFFYEPPADPAANDKWLNRYVNDKVDEARQGMSVALEPTSSLVAWMIYGAPGFGNGYARARLITTEQQFSEILLTASDGALGDSLGFSVAYLGGLFPAALVGAPGDGDSLLEEEIGAVYAFDAIQQTGVIFDEVHEVAKIRPAAAAPGDQFGFSLGSGRISEGSWIGGAPFTDERGGGDFPALDVGAAYLYPGAGVTISGDLRTVDEGSRRTLQLSLDNQPSGSVVLNLSIDRPDQAAFAGGASARQIILGPSDVNAFVPLEVDGLFDGVIDGTQTVIISASVDPSSEDYVGLPDATFELAVVDRDEPRFVVDPWPVVTREFGPPVDVTVTLATQLPAGEEIQVEVRSSDETEGLARPGLFSPHPVLVFDSGTSTRTIRVTPGQDVFELGQSTADGDIGYELRLMPITSTIGRLDGFDPDDIPAINTDFGIDIVAAPGTTFDPIFLDRTYQTTESGGKAAFDVRLIAPPTAPVTFTASTDDPAQGVVSSGLPGSNTQSFILSNTTSHRVEVAGLPDHVAETEPPFDLYSLVFSAAGSADPRYSGLVPQAMHLVNVDNGLTGAPVTADPPVLTVTEGAPPPLITVQLAEPPTTRVAVPVISSNVDKIRTSVFGTTTFEFADTSVTQLVFEAGEQQKDVFVYAKDDEVIDYYTEFVIQLQTVTGDPANPSAPVDPRFAGFDPQDVPLTLVDDDVAGVEIVESLGGTVVDENGTTFEPFVVRLTAKPAAIVHLEVAVGDPSEGFLRIDGGPAGDVLQLQMSSLSTDVSPPSQQILVVARDDAEDDGDVVWPVTFRVVDGPGSDPNWDRVGINDMQVTTLDDDTTPPAVVLTPLGATELVERFASVEVEVSLATAATGPVTIELGVSDATELSVSPTQIIVDPTAGVPTRTVTVTSVNDALDDGDQPADLRILAVRSGDPQYDGAGGPPLPLTVLDDDTASVVAALFDTNATTESGGQRTVLVRLGSEPSSPVTLSVASTDPGEGTTPTTQLTFTPADALEPQAVQVTGVDDDLVDGDVSFGLRLTPTGGDPAYLSLAPVEVDLVNRDDDTVSIQVTRAGLLVGEDGTAVQFFVALGSRPSADVQIDLASLDPTEGEVSTPRLIFTPGTATQHQTVTITGVDDSLHDGDIGFVVDLAPAASDDPAYDGLDAGNLEFFNLDDEAPKIGTSPVALAVGEGEAASFDVVLGRAPTHDVTVELQSVGPMVSVDPTLLTFTPADGTTPRRVTVTSADDRLRNGTRYGLVEMLAATSDDPEFDGFRADEVRIEVIDDDVAGVSANPDPLILTPTRSGTIDLALTSEPRHDVTAELVVTGVTGQVPQLSSHQLTYLAGDSGAPQTVTVIDRNGVGFSGTFEIEVVLSSIDPDYDGRVLAISVIVSADTQPPTVTAPVDVTVEATGPLTPVSLGTAIVVDNVDVGLVATPDPAGPFPVGTTVVTWSATDSGGNTGSANQTVDVTDTTPPAVTLLGPPLIQIVVGDAYVEDGAEAVDLVDGDLSGAISIGGSVDTATLGTYTLTYMARDSVGNVGQATRVVRVVDVTVPVVTPPADRSAEATGPLTSVELGTATVVDDVDVDLEAVPDPAGPFPLGTTVVTWSATDSSGNTGVATQDVEITDTSPPAIVLLGDDPMSLVLDEPFVDPGLSAYDLVDGDVTDAVVIEGFVDTAVVGTYILIYRVADALGNEATATRTVHVVAAPAAVPVPVDDPLSLSILALLLALLAVRRRPA